MSAHPPGAAAPRRRTALRTASVRLTTLLLTSWLGLTVLFAALQRKLVFPAPDVPVDALDTLAEREGARTLSLTTADGETLYGWHLPAAPGRPLVLYFSGNGSTVGGVPTHLALLRQAGVGLLHVNYRGYPGSTGVPSQEGLLADARAAWAEARSLHPPADLVVMGTSLGGGVATLLTAELSRAGTPPRALVVESSFRSVRDVARELYPFLPVRALLRHPFDSHAVAPDVAAPVLLLHGDADRLIDVQHARHMAARHRDAALVVVPGAGHADPLLRDAAAWQAFAELIGLP